MSEWPELEAKYFMRTVQRTPVTLVRGEGVWVWDEAGRRYLDMVAGVAVNSLGHCHPVVIEAVTEQVKTLVHTSNLFYTTPQIQLAELLVRHSALDRVFFCNSGAEATEGAVKLARRYGKLKLSGAYEVITAINSFHGRTLAMVAASGQAKFQKPYTPLPVGFINVPFNDIEAIKAATTSRTCAVMLEPLQGEGGVNLAARGYLASVRQWCDEKGILLILDEIQTGLGRTGSLFGYEQHGIEPDVMALAKGLAGGVPIGAILAKERAAVFAPGDHGSTFGGNPLACAAGYATFKFIVENDIAGNAGRMGDRLLAGLAGLRQKFPCVSDTRGKGLLAAMQFTSDIAPQALAACLERGLLVNQLRPDALRFMPPLIINRDEIDIALAILDKALESLEA